jgi:hypothetical protein
LVADKSIEEQPAQMRFHNHLVDSAEPEPKPAHIGCFLLLLE